MAVSEARGLVCSLAPSTLWNAAGSEKTPRRRNSFKRKRPDIPLSSPESLQFLLSPCHELMFVFHTRALRHITEPLGPGLRCPGPVVVAAPEPSQQRGPKHGQTPYSSHSHRKQTKTLNTVISCALASTSMIKGENVFKL